VSSVTPFQIGRKVANLSRVARQECSDLNGAFTSVSGVTLCEKWGGTSKIVCMFDRRSIGCTVFGSPCLIHQLNFTATAKQQTTLITIVFVMHHLDSAVNINPTRESAPVRWCGSDPPTDR
jgi:hypothetical protein